MKMVKTRIIVDDHTKERFILTFDHNGILFALEPIKPTPPSISDGEPKNGK